MNLWQWSEEDDAFFDRLIFGDESTFHISGKVNEHNVHIWGTDNLREMVEHVRDSPNGNVFCAVSHTKVYGPFFFHENTLTGRITSTCSVSGCCLNYKKTVQTSFSSEMELRLTGIWRSKITRIKICFDIGLATQQTRTWH
jgi:hypothetical protein